MGIEPDDLVARYGEMSEAELLAVAREYDELGEVAQGALRAEFARRGMEAPLVEDLGEPVDGKLVTVELSRDMAEAIVTRSLLEAAGIRTFIPYENVARMGGWQQWATTRGGIRLQVEEKDEEAARELLKTPMDVTGTEFEQPRCPKCGSKEIRFAADGQGSAVIRWLLVGETPLPWWRERWLCDACGARWDDPDEQSAK